MRMSAVDHHSPLIRIHDHAFSKDSATTYRFGSVAFECYLRELGWQEEMRAERVGELCYKAKQCLWQKRDMNSEFQLTPDMLLRQCSSFALR